MARVKAHVDTTQLRALEARLGRKAFAREIAKGVRNGTGRIKRMTGKLVSERYNLSRARFGQKTRTYTQARGDALDIVFKGRRMRLAEFVTDKGPPITATVREGGQLNDRSFFIGMRKKQGGSRVNRAHIRRHATKTDRVDMVFTREGESRYPIKALFTLATPQMVEHEEVSGEVLDFAGEQLLLAAQKAVEKAIAKASGG